MDYPRTLNELRAARYQTHAVKDELRRNLITKLRSGEKLFPGIVGYQDTVIPQLINAILSRHNIILLGLRGQAKSRIIRLLTDLLDDRIPIIAGFVLSPLTAGRCSPSTAIQHRSTGSAATHASLRNSRRQTLQSPTSSVTSIRLKPRRAVTC
jgi:Mg-chelatase subunit ChlI